MKKILILGGKPIGSTEIVLEAKRNGYYVIVTDYLEIKDSPAKALAHEAWDISTADVDTLIEKCIENNVSGVFTGVHEFNIEMMIKLCSILNFPCFINMEQWLKCNNKQNFKNLCKEFNIPTSRQYNVGDISSYSAINYPVIVKPTDSSGSRGFHLCNSKEELLNNYPKALAFSESKNVLIEEYQPYDSVIIHYTIIDGKIYFSGISDKVSVKFKSTGSSVMGFQSFPSNNEKQYLEHMDGRVQQMIKSLSFTNGVLWIEAFNNDGQFIMNEIGTRYGGSLTYYPVHFFYNIDQLGLLLKYQMGEHYGRVYYQENHKRNKYCILPLHIYSGKICIEDHIDDILAFESVNACVKVHNKGDIIEDWGSAQQVYCYLHFSYDNQEHLKSTIEEVLKTIKVLDENNINMIHTLFDLETL